MNIVDPRTRSISCINATLPLVVECLEEFFRSRDSAEIYKSQTKELSDELFAEMEALPGSAHLKKLLLFEPGE